MTDLEMQLYQGFATAFVDGSQSSNLAYKPEFVSNNYKEGKKVLSAIERELFNCDEFSISVAFITMGGITPLLQTLKELENRNIPGRILTTDYLGFSDPEAMSRLAELNNIELKMYRTRDTEDGFHTKGYIFKKDEIYRVIVGSSNMTSSALTKNKEWNTKIVSTEQGEYTKEILDEFNQLWNSTFSYDYDDFIQEYTTYYNVVRKQRKIAKQAEIASIEAYKLTPNSMQLGFISNLKKIREAGEEKALLISATGTGKTYASAFALREDDPKKVLFLVHREQIAKQAIKSYKKVFGATKTFGLLSGNEKDYSADYLFSTMQMMSKDETLARFEKDEFQTIVIDEAHRVGANSYQKILDYFEPEFWLGMTASPERTDDYDVYEAFDHNIAYEIRLQQALEENLLCDFHYFGITDLAIDGVSIDEDTGLRNFSLLTSDARVDYVIEQAEFYGHSGDRVKGLIFCSSTKEAKELSNKFNLRGYKTTVLTGADSQESRECAIEKLVADDGEKLDYIFTVDIFNEGVDIPEINQVIMLRPTESPIVFVQQLGRGLRKADDKEYVVILDFIGNYKNNFMIPIALSGDRTYNKDNIRRYVMEGNRIIPGASTIHFDEISKGRIFRSIDQIKGIKSIIKKSYQDLKYRLGRVPLLLDFYEYGEIDPLVILENYKTYYHFIMSVDSDECKFQLQPNDKLTLEYLSKVMARGKRPHETEVIAKMMLNNLVDEEEICSEIEQQYGIVVSMADVEAALRNMEGNFVSKEDELEKYKHMNILKRDDAGMARRMQGFADIIKRTDFYTLVLDLIETSRAIYKGQYLNKERDGQFVLYEKYSRRDVCQLLNCERDISSVMYGMKRIEDDVCIFVTYNKQEDKSGKEYIDGKPDYADEFINNQMFMWDSQIGRGPDSTYMKDVIGAKRKRLFIKKSDAEGTDFYYMGMFDIVEFKGATKKDNRGKEREITKVKVRMRHEVREDLLQYLRSNI